MTTYETIMLSVCFGAVMGTFIGNLIILIKYGIDEIREKRKKKKQAENDLPKEN